MVIALLQHVIIVWEQFLTDEHDDTLEDIQEDVLVHYAVNAVQSILPMARDVPPNI
jgi:hypothetical protein